MRAPATTLRQMLEFVDAALRHAPASRAAFDADEVVRGYVERQVELLGEAARRVPEGFRAAHPEVPWRELAGTRDFLIHAYDRIDRDILWSVLTRELPSLRSVLASLVGGSEAAS